MIGVRGAEPRILITTDIFKERDVCEDVLNILFSYGVEAACRDFYGKGFAVVYLKSGVDSYAVAKLLVSRNVRGYWVIPIDIACRSRYEEIAKAVVNAILLKGYSLPLKVVGVCRKRGDSIDSCSKLLRYVGETIEALGIAVVDFKDYEYVVRIEIVYDDAFVSVYRRGDEKAFRTLKAAV